HPRLEDEPRRDAGGKQCPGRVRRAERDPYTAVADDEEQDDHHEGPREPELVAEHGEDRVGVRRGQEAEFLAARPQPLTEQPAERQTVERLDRLEAALLRIRPWIEEREEALEPVRLLDRDGQPQHRGQSSERGEDAETRARDEV